MSRYGGPPVRLAEFSLDGWAEFCHYLYLPVRMPIDECRPLGPAVRLPERLGFLYAAVRAATLDAAMSHPDPYVYVTARRGYATPDNPLNRPGWHCDGFGTDDLNYVWWDRWSSRFAVQPFPDVGTGHVESMRDFERHVQADRVRGYPDRTLYRLDPYVVHNTPLVEPPGGMRSFLKVSVSRHRYNLEGNSHNHAFDYAWPMWPRQEARNHPTHGEADYLPEEPCGVTA